MNKFAVVSMDTTQECQLFDTSVSLNGDWFSPAQDPDFEAMAAWWSGNVDRKTFFYKMHKHLKNDYKKWAGKKSENENIMNSLNKRKKKFKRKFRHQLMLQRFLNHFIFL